jgi:hypothetical protein
MIRADVVTSSGASGAQAAQRRSTRCESRQSQTSQPAWTWLTGLSSNSIAVTTPKLPPPAAESPEQVGLHLLVGARDRSVCGHELHRRDAVRL